MEKPTSKYIFLLHRFSSINYIFDIIFDHLSRFNQVSLSINTPEQLFRLSFNLWPYLLEICKNTHDCQLMYFLIDFEIFEK